MSKRVEDLKKDTGQLTEVEQNNFSNDVFRTLTIEKADDLENELLSAKR